MKPKTVIFLSLMLLSLTVHAQRERPRHLPAYDFKKLHWGFTVGLNRMDFGIQRVASPQQLYADVVPRYGFQVNVVSDLRLTDYWTLRFLPGINLGDRAFYYYTVNGATLEPVTPSIGNNPDNPNENTNSEYLWIQGSAFLDFPLLFKYRAERVNNYRPYVIGGLSYRLDMSASKTVDNQKFGLNRHDIYLEGGFGIDTYLQYFKFSPEIKVAMGLFNMINHDNVDADAEYAASISSLRSFIIMINFHFE